MNRYTSNNYALDIHKKVLSQGQIVDKAAINQAIESILMTGYRERVFEPNYGCFLMSIIFEHLDSDTAENLLDKIIKHILIYEDRIRILVNQCAMNITRSNNSMALTIKYVITADGTSGEFNRRIVF